MPFTVEYSFLLRANYFFFVEPYFTFQNCTCLQVSLEKASQASFLKQQETLFDASKANKEEKKITL